jgi:hypothetical protein
VLGDAERSQNGLLRRCYRDAAGRLALTPRRAVLSANTAELALFDQPIEPMTCAPRSAIDITRRRLAWSQPECPAPRAAGLASACFDVCAGAYELTDAGVDIVTISKRLGHASPAITLKVYGQLFRKDGKAPEAINAALADKGKD